MDQDGPGRRNPVAPYERQSKSEECFVAPYWRGSNSEECFVAPYGRESKREECFVAPYGRESRSEECFVAPYGLAPQIDSRRCDIRSEVLQEWTEVAISYGLYCISTKEKHLWTKTAQDAEIFDI